MHAILLAGGTPAPNDPLYPYSRGAPKAQIEVAGKAMGQWVIEALDGAQEIERILVVGLSESDGLRSRRSLTYVPEQGGLLANARAGLAALRRMDPRAAQALFSVADIPAVRPEAVDWRVRIADPEADFDYIVIERAAMEARFPGSRRTYVRLREGHLCGGDMNVVRADLDADDVLWDRLVESRKSPVHQARLIGWSLAALLLTGRLTLADGERRVSRRLGLRARVHLCPYAEIGMDVDKPSQLEILRADLAGS
jgi:CTP:molybdopterin cytidylyltransferase MocA